MWLLLCPPQGPCCLCRHGASAGEVQALDYLCDALRCWSSCANVTVPLAGSCSMGAPRGAPSGGAAMGGEQGVAAKASILGFRTGRPAVGGRCLVATPRIL